MPHQESAPLKPDAPAESWANAPTSAKPVLQPASYNFNEGPFAPDYYEDTVLEAGEPEDD